ncbi:MAG TPA: bifunctional glutamate N-acetyltransferase/amino-acid acetyltransferase ArgJ [Verrucomicrobiae bacterium]|nr:bifunctional glutamate N-acetyltransferase/amino-acid acetyltransferase ArgJ [Verrucomicrobiae bacterium]
MTAPKGFLAAGVFCDIKRLGTGKGSQKGQKRDLALIVSKVPAAVAGMYTTNQICAAPVKVSAERTANPMAQAIVVNSGNANACTGKRGFRDARRMTAIAGGELGITPSDVLVCSTGRIGLPMPMGNVKNGILMAAHALSDSREAAANVAEAIMTSDTRPKEIAVEFTVGGKTVRIGGVCKGAGMIQPGMSPTGARPASALHATMLGFITTDVAIDPKELKRSLEIAVAQSFNRITVDGDMSTNDTVLALANGQAGNKPINRTNRNDMKRFQEALDFVCLELAKKIVRDGEGISRFVTVRVHGAKTSSDAEDAARSVANSSLVKTSWCGGDPNWGRILDALGYSRAIIIEEKIDVGYSRPGEKMVTYAVKRGQPTKIPFATLVKLVAEKEFDLHISLNLGSGHAVVYTCDLTENYVDFNKGDVTDPSSLGG